MSHLYEQMIRNGTFPNAGVVPLQNKGMLWFDAAAKKIYFNNGATWDTYTAAPNFADNEKPAGSVSGLNTNYTLAHEPTAGSLRVFVAGLRVDPANFSLSGAVLTILTSLVTGTVVVDYRYA